MQSMHDAQRWVADSRTELAGLLKGEGHRDEAVLQHWLERHPTFVPGSRGSRGVSGRPLWPSALVTQPRLLGFAEKVPDFCWLTADSADLTAMLVEIEVPAKRWQRKDMNQHADLTQARGQLNHWRAWFAQPLNAASFLRDYLVSDDLVNGRNFRQHYVLVHGSRKEYASSLARTSVRANSINADETLMSFDRLLDIGSVDHAYLGCVRRAGEGFEAVAVPPTWEPERLSERALQVTAGYPEAVARMGLAPETQASLLTRLEDARGETPPTGRWRPQR
jgi:Domain of unknown function (DUF4263)